MLIAESMFSPLLVATFDPHGSLDKLEIEDVVTSTTSFRCCEGSPPPRSLRSGHRNDRTLPLVVEVVSVPDAPALGGRARTRDRTPCFLHAHLDPGLFRTAPSAQDRSRHRLTHPPLPSTPLPSWPSPGLSPNTPRPNHLTQSISSLSLSSPHPTTQLLRDRRHPAESAHPVLLEEDEELESQPVANDDDEGIDDDENHESMTRQLAQTATSVREISKQLGRTRIKSSIQSVLIITKARDNHLIRLTRQLVISLAHESLQPSSEHSSPPLPAISTTPKNSSSSPFTPLIVYVDHQLRHSSRFDLPGLERDYPQWFLPLPSHHRFKRRFSRTDSTSSLNSIRSNRSSRSSTSHSTAESSIQVDGRLRYWTPEMCAKSPELFDLVITLGGDGTVLFASWLFQRIVPPIIPFALGSLGFLTNFNYGDHQKVLSEAIQRGVRINLRMRFNCTVYRTRNGPAKRRAVRSAKTGEIFMNALGRTGWEAIESVPGSSDHQRSIARSAPKDDKEIACFSTYPAESFQVLNELVVDRGPSPYVSLLELFGDDHHMTTVQADGLTVSTPTGSTAYSLSAGGSLVHPEIPAMLITPICPHTLSFRPMLLPDTMELRICVPYASRSTAWASFDGRGRVELQQGDHIKVTASAYPFPTVCNVSQSTDWFQSISRTLKWNERERQKSFVVVEEDDNLVPQTAYSDESVTSPPSLHGDLVDGIDDDDEDDEAEQYDIDDLSTEATSMAGTVHNSSSSQPSRSNHHSPQGDDECDHSSSIGHYSKRYDLPIPPPTVDSVNQPSDGRDTHPGSIPSLPVIKTHARVRSKGSNPNLKAFAVWGLDSSSSSEGSMSDC